MDQPLLVLAGGIDSLGAYFCNEPAQVGLPLATARTAFVGRTSAGRLERGRERRFPARDELVLAGLPYAGLQAGMELFST